MRQFNNFDDAFLGTLSKKNADVLLEPFDTDYNTFSKDVLNELNKTGNIDFLHNSPAYYKRPTEIHARLNELRHYINPDNPWREITNEDIKSLYSIDGKFVSEMSDIENKQLVNNLNKLPGGDMLPHVKRLKSLKEAFNKSLIGTGTVLGAGWLNNYKLNN